MNIAKESKWDNTLYWTAGIFVLVAVPVSMHGIIQYLVNCQVQKYVIQILFMIPVVLIQSWFLLIYQGVSRRTLDQPTVD
jgi:hypothetical protein